MGGRRASLCHGLSFCRARVTCACHRSNEQRRRYDLGAGRSLKQMLLRRASPLDAHYIKQARGVCMSLPARLHSGLREHACLSVLVCENNGRELMGGGGADGEF